MTIEHGLIKRDFLKKAVGIAAISKLDDRTNNSPENNSPLSTCLSPIMVFGIIALGFYVMLGGLNHKKSDKDRLKDLEDEVRELKKRL